MRFDARRPGAGGRPRPLATRATHTPSCPFGPPAHRAASRPPRQGSRRFGAYSADTATTRTAGRRPRARARRRRAPAPRPPRRPGRAVAGDEGDELGVLAERVEHRLERRGGLAPGDDVVVDEAHGVADREAARGVLAGGGATPPVRIAASAASIARPFSAARALRSQRHRGGQARPAASARRRPRRPSRRARPRARRP